MMEAWNAGSAVSGRSRGSSYRADQLKGKARRARVGYAPSEKLFYLGCYPRVLPTIKMDLLTSIKIVHTALQVKFPTPVIVAG